MMIALVNQSIIAVLGIATAWLLTEKSATKRYWGAWIGLVSEPFWFYESWRTGTWGIAILCFIYAIVYIKGIRNGKENNSFPSRDDLTSGWCDKRLFTSRGDTKRNKVSSDS